LSIGDHPSETEYKFSQQKTSEDSGACFSFSLYDLESVAEAETIINYPLFQGKPNPEPLLSQELSQSRGTTKLINNRTL
jgi:hypothetical protein